MYLIKSNSWGNATNFSLGNFSFSVKCNLWKVHVRHAVFLVEKWRCSMILCFFQVKSDFTLFLVWFFYYSSALLMQLLAEQDKKKIVEFGPETGFLEHCFWWKLKIFSVFAFNLRLKTLTGKYIIEHKNWLKQNLGFFWSFPYIYN